MRSKVNNNSREKQPEVPMKLVAFLEFIYVLHASTNRPMPTNQLLLCLVRIKLAKVIHLSKPTHCTQIYGSSSDII